MSDDKGLGIWNRVLATALKAPGVRVDRGAFLLKALLPYCSLSDVERAIATTPAQAGISPEAVALAAESTIKWHRAGVASVSAAAGLPGGWWLAGTIPGDLAQYFWHVTVVLQKLAYLHGWPALLEGDADVDDETKLILSLFVGVMLGTQGAAEGLSKLASSVSSEPAHRLPRSALTKYALVRVAKQVARWIGVSLTKRRLAEYLGRAVPVVGGVVAGSITWVSFGQGGRRLQQHLAGLSLARP
jgi:hypothetical protein